MVNNSYALLYASAVCTNDAERKKAKRWYPIECEHGYDCCPICDGQRRDPETLKPVT